MGRAYKNFWSLNIDEAVVTGILRDHVAKNVEVFMPLNAQMKDVDLVLMNMQNKKTISIQVKGSKAYEPTRAGTKKFGAGSTGWFTLNKNAIINSSADYFIFLVYVIEQNQKTGRRTLEPHTLTIPTQKFQESCQAHKKIGTKNRWDFFFWINPTTKEALDVREKETYSLSPYLDNKGLHQMSQDLL